jgi:predicted nucleotidyltransferase component of viral defense system
MNESQRYLSARAFRQALEARLQVCARATGVHIARLRKQVAFDRFLTRLFSSGSEEAACVLKGGYALELKFLHARATNDIGVLLHERRNG